MGGLPRLYSHTVTFLLRYSANTKYPRFYEVELSVPIFVTLPQGLFYSPVTLRGDNKCGEGYYMDTMPQRRFETVANLTMEFVMD